MVIGVTVYEGRYVEAGLQEWVANNRPELVDYQDQACIDVMFLMRSITEEDSSAETMLKNLQIMLLDNSQNDISYSMPFMLGSEAGDIRTDGYKCYHVSSLCPEKSVNSRVLCIKLESNDKTGEVFFDINVTVHGFDPDQYDKRFLDK